MVKVHAMTPDIRIALHEMNMDDTNANIKQQPLPMKAQDINFVRTYQ